MNTDVKKPDGFFTPVKRTVKIINEVSMDKELESDIQFPKPLYLKIVMGL